MRVIPDAIINGDPEPGADHRLPNIAHVTFPGCEGDAMLMLLDAQGIECSTGSACAAGVPQPSHVLLAMGYDDVAARGSLRFSLGHTSTEADVDALLARTSRGAPAALPSRLVGQGRVVRVIAAMSGGVDSAVAAARAVDAGHDVTGVHLALSRNPSSYRSGARGCCSIEDAGDARRAADELGIPFYVWDMSEEFADDVVDDFIAEYTAGRTPNPCLRCNEKIKFAAVLDRALALGFDAVATGHYAQLETAADGTIEMHRAIDMGKDQSYVLGVLTQEQLAHSLFPLGDTTRTTYVRRPRAAGSRSRRSPTATTSASSPTATTPAGWARSSGPSPARSSTRTARSREHDGAYAFTIGQRRGLRLGIPADDGKPRFVLDIEPVSGTVTVGSRESLVVDALGGIKPLWCGTPRPGRSTARSSCAPTATSTRQRSGSVTTYASSCTIPRAASPLVRRASSTTAPASSARPPSPYARVAWSASLETAGYARHRHRLDAGHRLRRVAPRRHGRGRRLRVRPRAPGARGARRHDRPRLAVLDGLDADLQPDGWRVGVGEGIDQRRARSLLAQDLDVAEELADHAGPLKLQVTGPLTLAAHRRTSARRQDARRPRRPPRARRVTRGGPAYARRRRRRRFPGASGRRAGR